MVVSEALSIYKRNCAVLETLSIVVEALETRPLGMRGIKVPIYMESKTFKVQQENGSFEIQPMYMVSIPMLPSYVDNTCFICFEWRNSMESALLHMKAISDVLVNTATVNLDLALHQLKDFMDKGTITFLDETKK